MQLKGSVPIFEVAHQQPGVVFGEKLIVIYIISV